MVETLLLGGVAIVRMIRGLDLFHCHYKFVMHIKVSFHFIHEWHWLVHVNDLHCPKDEDVLSWTFLRFVLKFMLWPILCKPSWFQFHLIVLEYFATRILILCTSIVDWRYLKHAIAIFFFFLVGKGREIRDQHRWLLEFFLCNRLVRVIYL